MKEFGVPEQTPEEAGISPEEMGDFEAREKEAEEKFRAAFTELIKARKMQHEKLTDEDRAKIEAANDTMPYMGDHGIMSIGLIRRLAENDERSMSSLPWMDSLGWYVNSDASVGQAFTEEEISRIMDDAESRSGVPEGGDAYLKRFLDDSVMWRSRYINELTKGGEIAIDDLPDGNREFVQDCLRGIEKVEQIRKRVMPGV